MKKASHRKNAKSYMRVIALFLCALIFSSCANCASCNFADLFNIEIIPDASEKESASGIEGSSDEEKHTHTHSEMPTEKQTELPTEEPTEPVPEWNEDIKHEIQVEYYDKILNREKHSWESYPDVQFLGKFSDAYAVNVLDNGINGRIGAYFVQGYEFRHKRDNPPYIYRQGTFYTLENALSSGMITLDELGSIYVEFKQINYKEYKRIHTDTPELNMDYGILSVKIQPNYNQKEYTAKDFADIGCTAIEEWITKEGEPYEIYRTIDVFFPANTREETLAAGKELEKREDIYSASPNYSGGTWNSLPNDSEYVSSNNDYWAINKIQLPEAWEIETGSNTVLVGVMDTGIDGTHPDLVNHINTELSKCFSSHYDSNAGLEDEHGHGTQVAGIIGAEANNTVGIAGICHNIQLVSLRVNKANGYIDYGAVARAINYAESVGIKIINFSASITNSDDVKTAISEYSGLIICSAGNGGNDIDDPAGWYKYYPSSWENTNIISVGASTSTDEQKPNSNYGATSVDLFAPGVNILTTYPIAMCQAGGDDHYNHTATGAYSVGYHYFENTSAATPFVTGVAALVLAQNPDMTNLEIRDRILDNVDVVSGLSTLCVEGGRLNAYKAVHPTHKYEHHYVLCSPEQHFAYCCCGNLIVEDHEYTHHYVPNTGGVTHTEYCACGASRVAEHCYDRVYAYMDEDEHRVHCACGENIITDHEYTHHYETINSIHAAYCGCDDGPLYCIHEFKGTLYAFNYNEHRVYCECGEYRLEYHSFTENISPKDEDEHYGTCECGEVGLTPHVYDGTCENYGNGLHKVYCECGTHTITPEHRYDNSYQWLSTNHNAFCVCGESIVEEHDYDDLYPGTDMYHRGICNCGAQNNVMFHQYTHSYQNNGENHLAWCECGFDYAYQIEEHSFTDWFERLDDEVHVAFCRCGAAIVQAHTSENSCELCG